MSDVLAPAQQLPADRGSPRDPPAAYRGRQRRRPTAGHGLRRLPLLPALIYMIVVTQAPFVVTLWYSFRGWNTLTPGSNKFVGFKEYSHGLRRPDLPHGGGQHRRAHRVSGDHLDAPRDVASPS